LLYTLLRCKLRGHSTSSHQIPTQRRKINANSSGEIGIVICDTAISFGTPVYWVEVGRQFVAD